MKVNEINFKVLVDDNHLPVDIKWEVSGAEEKSHAKSMMVALWDATENNTLRIDLWTKDMSVDEMKKFYHQNIMTLTDTYIRATNDTKTAEAVKNFFLQVGKDIGVLQ